MRLGNLLQSANKNYRKISVRGISFDSRKVKIDYIFFAIRGQQTSGINFIKEAISKGASAIISDKKAKYPYFYLKMLEKVYLKLVQNFTKKNHQI